MSTESSKRGRSMTPIHHETHLVGRIGWLRAAVLGANDGIISTASLILGVASAAASQTNVLLRHRRTCRRRYVHGGGRVCLSQLTIGHRNCRSRARKAGTGK